MKVFTVYKERRLDKSTTTKRKPSKLYVLKRIAWLYLIDEEMTIQLKGFQNKLPRFTSN